MKLVKRLAMCLVLLAITATGSLALVSGLDSASKREALKSSNLTGLKNEALAMFPRGSRLDEAAALLARIGFACEPVPHPLPDISGPSLRCASNGRGYPDFPAVNVILLTRNGMISDVDVWNIMARADGEPDDIDFTAIGASDALPPQLRRPDKLGDEEAGASKS